MSACLISQDYLGFEKAKLNCRACPVYFCYECVVPSEGNKNNPTTVIIGEAPGADEVAQKRPFIGKAGQLLRKYLREYGFDKKNTLITNTIPCRPEKNKFPDNTDKGVHNVRACINKWVVNELCILNPTYVILLGSKALTYVAGNPRWESLTKQRGRPFKLVFRDSKMWAMPTFHPSYVMRKKNMSDGEKIVSDFESDLRTVAEMMKKGITPENKK